MNKPTSVIILFSVYFFTQPTFAQAVGCSVGDLAGVYQSRYDKIDCKATGGALDCCYSANCRYDLDLTLSGDGQSLIGKWDHKNSRTGTARFDVKKGCLIGDGAWGEGTAEPTVGWWVRDKLEGYTDTAVVADTGISCKSNAQCPTDTYCAIDGVCYANTQLPKDGQMAADACACETADGPIVPSGSTSNPAPPGLIPGASVGGMDDPQPVDATVITPTPASPINGASAGGIMDDPQPVGATVGTPTPVGPPLFGGISGDPGGYRVVMDLEDRFLRTIVWRDTKIFRPGDANKVCGVHIDSTTHAEGAVPGADSISFIEPCERYTEWEESLVSELRTDQVIVSISACTDYDRLEEFRAISWPMDWSGRIEKAGGREVLGPPLMPGCELQSRVECPADTAATGITIYYDVLEGIFGPAEVMRALELICREVGLR